MVDAIYMRRALQLARNGELDASPNPMVGAVIVGPDGRIIGEGWHRRCGEGHAEVNAVNSVRDKSLLTAATMYVTLEPCSHYGRTPPCAGLIIKCGIPRVVVGTLDPFVKVAGRGVEMLRNAGVEVTVGVMERECRELNKRFFTAHTMGRPYVTLKWAQTGDGYIDGKISTPLTSMLVHRERARHDAILVGSGTVIADNPSLDTRLYAGHSPCRVILDRRGRVAATAQVFRDDNVIYYTDARRTDLPAGIIQVELDTTDISALLTDLYRRGITSLLVEGGAAVHRAFLDADLYDAIRVETSPHPSQQPHTPAPRPQGIPLKAEAIDGNTIYHFAD